MDELARGSQPDLRSALVLVEPWFDDRGQVVWHGMAIAGGKVIDDIRGRDRTVVLDECLTSLDAAGVAVEAVADE